MRRSAGHPPFSTRRRVPWLVFGLCALLVVDVLAWATWRVLALERAERKATRAADTAQRERLALWQMDSMVSVLLARESARPYFEFRSAYAADLPYGRAWETGESSRVRTSALAAGTGDPVLRLHFQIEPDGSVGSPQVSAGAELGPAPGSVARAQGLRAQRLVAELAIALREASAPALGRDESGLLITGEYAFADHDGDGRVAVADEHPSFGVGSGPSSKEEIPGALASAKSVMAPGTDAGELADSVGGTAPQTAAEPAGGEPVRTDTAASERDAGSGPIPEDRTGPEDLDLRQQLFDIAQSSNLAFNVERAGRDPAEPPVIVGLLQPRWLVAKTDAPELIFEREVRVGEARYTQGIWIDWPALRARLLAIAVRQMPGVRLEPVLTTDFSADHSPGLARGADRAGERGSDTLATIPVRLRLPAGDVSEAFWSPARVTLAVSWIAAVVALFAIGMVLRTSMRLADRRGRFVAAVTHELRSPLTTFRLHTDLLDRAHDGEQRRAHIAVLRGESRRLGEVIESVLVYAGMRSATNASVETTLGEVLRPVLATLSARVESAGGSFNASVSDGIADIPVRLRPGSVERILGNLVENACRYAGPSAEEAGDLEVTLTVGRTGKRIRIRVRDNGPGIPTSERAAIFRDFYRGVSASRVHRGLGLGLALARSLARAEGGDLRLVEMDGPGACFELGLPAD